MPEGFSLSSTGVLGGRGGGGGPGLTILFDVARALAGGGGGWPTNLPASGSGGGAANLGRGGPGGGGGDACRGGEGGMGLEDEFRLMPGASVRVLRAGGGAGGGPLFDAPVF